MYWTKVLGFSLGKFSSLHYILVCLIAKTCLDLYSALKCARVQGLLMKGQTSELGVAKVKKARNPQACSLLSLSSLFSGREKRKTHLSLFFFLFFFFSSFSCNKFLFFSLFTATQVLQDPAVPDLGLNPQKMKNFKDMGTPKILAQQRTVVKSGKQDKCRNCRRM